MMEGIDTGQQSREQCKGLLSHTTEWDASLFSSALTPLADTPPSLLLPFGSSLPQRASHTSIRVIRTY